MDKDKTIIFCSQWNNDGRDGIFQAGVSHKVNLYKPRNRFVSLTYKPEWKSYENVYVYSQIGLNVRILLLLYI